MRIAMAGGLVSAVILFSGVTISKGGEPTISFIELSSGFDQPGMESGRTEFEFGDVNGNGYLDLVSIGDHGSPFVNSGQAGIMVWFGDGHGNWSHFQTGNFGYGGVALADANNDGIMDIAYGMHHAWSGGNNFGNQLLEVSLGDGTGMNWTPWDEGLAQEGQTWGMFSTDFADINNNGWLDVGSVSFGCCDGLHVYLNNANGTWTHSWGYLGGNSSMEFVFGDISGDGNADFATSHGSGTVFLGDGTGEFTNADGNLPGGAWRTGVSIGDVNGNGRDELAWTTSTGIEVWTMIEPGVWQSLSANLANLGIGYHRTQIADMTLNGRGEIIAARPMQVVIYTLNDAGQWQLLNNITLPDGCGQAAALRAGGDATHNGYPDFIVVTKEDCGFWNLRGENQPRFFANAHVPTEPDIYAAFPRGGQTFLAGQVRFLRWHAAIPHEVRDSLPTVTIELSINGPEGPWQTVAEDIPPSGRYQWHLPPTLPSTDQGHLRFTLGTNPPAVTVTPEPFTIIGVASVPGDLNGDGVVDVFDLLILLGDWGQCADRADCAADLNGDGVVDVFDLLILLGNWG